MDTDFYFDLPYTKFGAKSLIQKLDADEFGKKKRCA